MEAHFCHVRKERSDTLVDHNYDKKIENKTLNHNLWNKIEIETSIHN